MKLLTKLTLFSAITTLLIVVLFILLLPYLVREIASRNTDDALFNQKQKVLKEIEFNGLDYYLQGETDYGSYSMLKDEYISLEPVDTIFKKDQLQTDSRIVEGDTIKYRILKHTFPVNDKKYLLEIGKNTAAIKQSGKELQKVALYALMALTGLTLITTFLYNRFLIAPLGEIISSKLQNKKIPFPAHAPVKTNTYDFKYLDDSIEALMLHINYAFEKEREFTSNASHELMTPISIMQSKIENLLMDESLQPAHFTKLEEMMITLKRLRKIVKSLLLISRMDNQQFARKDSFTPLKLIHEVINELTHRLEEKNLQLKISIQQNPILKNLNKDLLFQLFYNLINNAIKYNKENGELIISEEYDKTKNTYTIVIADKGIGIPADKLTDIFNRFKKTNQSKEGYGLGLSIVKSIIQYHEMDIQVESAENTGSAFKVIFYKDHLA